MKLHLAQSEGKNIVTGYGTGWVQVNQERVTSSFLLLPDVLRMWELVNPSELVAEDFGYVIDLAPEVFLLGTGMRQKFPSASCLRLLIEAGIGYEVMDMPAACRTYNILMSEGRNVALGVTI